MENTMYKKSTRNLDLEDNNIQIGRKASEAKSDRKKITGDLARAGAHLLDELVFLVQSN
jgi:hypothetical protein